MKTFAKMMVACLLGFAVMCVAIASDASDRVAITVCVVTGLAVSLALGVFDGADKSASEERRVKSEEFATAKHKQAQAA